MFDEAAAVHTTQYGWPHSSSTREPSDPPPKVVFRLALTLSFVSLLRGKPARFPCTLRRPVKALWGTYERFTSPAKSLLASYATTSLVETQLVIGIIFVRRDPTEGSPTVTLLRLLPSRGNAVRTTSRQLRLSSRANRPVSPVTPKSWLRRPPKVATGGVYKGQGRSRHGMLTRDYVAFRVHGPTRRKTDPGHEDSFAHGLHRAG